MTDIKRFSFVKPSAQTKLHIDFDWWTQSDSDWRVYLQGLLCNDHLQSFADSQETELIDWVDPETAEIQRVDGLQHVLITHCAKDPNFITEHTALVDAVFRVFITNGNAPLTITELAERLKKSPEKVLSTLAHGRVYRGIRPYLEN